MATASGLPSTSPRREESGLFLGRSRRCRDLSLVLGLITLDRKSLWYDEAFNGEHIKTSWHDLVLLVSHTEMSQGAYLVLLKAWATVTVNNTLWLRLPSVAAAALAAALLVPLGTRLFDRTTAIAAGVLLATNELLVRWSQQARTYALVTLAVVVATILFVRALDDPRRRNWLLYAVAAAFAVYCHFWAGFVIVAALRERAVRSEATAPASRGRGRRRVPRPDRPGPLLHGARRAEPTRVDPRSVDRRTPQPRHGDERPQPRAGGRNHRRPGGARLPGVGRRANENGYWRLALVGGWIFLPIVLALIVSEVRQPVVVSRYAIVLTPALALASALLLTTLARGRLLVVGAALVLIVAIPGPRIVDWYQSQPEDWRERPPTSRANDAQTSP